MQTFIYISLLVILDGVGLSLAKQWQLTNNKLILIAGMLVFSLIPIVFGLMTKLSAFGVANATWAAVTALLFPIIGFFIFQETISVWQIIGICTVAFGLLLMEVK